MDWVFSHRNPVGWSVCEDGFVNIQTANTVTFMTELPDVYTAFAKESVEWGRTIFLKKEKDSLWVFRVRMRSKCNYACRCSKSKDICEM